MDANASMCLTQVCTSLLCVFCWLLLYISSPVTGRVASHSLIKRVAVMLGAVEDVCRKDAGFIIQM